MNEDVFVTGINNPEIKRGIGKNNKPWTMAHVQLSNGETAYIFNPIAIGDPVEMKLNGQYKNWSRKRIDKSEEAVQLLKVLVKQTAAIMKATGADVGVELPKADPPIKEGFINDSGAIEFPDNFLDA